MNVTSIFPLQTAVHRHVTNSVMVYCGWATIMKVQKAISKLKEFVTKTASAHQTLSRRHIKRLESFARQNQLHTTLKHKHSTKEHTYIPKQ